MDKVKVKKADLVRVISRNRDRHRGQFEEAIEAYRRRAVEILEAHVELIKSGKRERVMVDLPIPEDHTEDYARVLGMLDMSVEDEVELDMRSYRQYVEDNWAWKRDFVETSSYYVDHAG